MKLITVAFFTIIALVFSVVPDASPPAQAATACEYGLVIVVGYCQDPGTGECAECTPAAVSVKPDDPDNCPTTDASSVPDLMRCCSACGGTLILPMGPPLPVR
jgi:hypothetical protein